ncbi:MAG: DinB family protein [Bacteroidota bacterium]
MKDFFKEMLQYTMHFNQAIIEQLTANDIHPEKAVLLLNHTLNAHEVWNARIKGEECKTAIWGIRPIEDLSKINTENYKESLQIIDFYDFDTIIEYTNSSNKSFKNTVKDILFHVINHSTYHRGQTATDVKQYGITPLLTDYIFFKRDSN